MKILNIFQICRGKFFRFFREILDRVPPCPSTWHKFETRIQKYQIWDPISALLFSIKFLASSDILVELAFINNQIRFSSIQST